MKKILIFMAMLIILSGCGKVNDKSVLKDFAKKVQNLKAYHLEGDMEIINNEDTYKYSVVASFKQKDMFKISLKNTSNNHEQIILKNKDGVYVLTPSLNKSFKFQSEWPYNNSQVYLLHSILNDLKGDDNRIFEETDNYYVFTTKVNYPNNRRLTSQVIYLDKNYNVKEVHVLNDSKAVEIKMVFKTIDLNPVFNDTHFDLNTNMKTTSTEDTVKDVTKIEDIIYPMFVPAATYLSDKKVIAKDIGERVIMTFDGEKPFILIEETVSKEDEIVIIPSSGEPELLVDTIGSLTDSSVSWISNGMEYYIASDKLNRDELITVARSISALPVMK